MADDISVVFERERERERENTHTHTHTHTFNNTIWSLLHIWRLIIVVVDDIYILGVVLLWFDGNK